MSQILEGGPEERRRYLNLMLAQTIPAYVRALSEYSQALSQRNALLKTLNERTAAQHRRPARTSATGTGEPARPGGAERAGVEGLSKGGNSEQLDAWDEALSRLGAQIILWRIQAVQEIERLAARVHHELTRGREVLRLSYEPAFDPLPQPNGQLNLMMDTPVDRSGLKLEDIRAGFVERLARIRKDEIMRGMTTIGPHRDELRFLANGINLGNYGSRGQIRTALLALKMAEVNWMKERTGAWPVILLDEVMAELDLERRADLLAYLGQREQVLFTTTDLNLFTPEFARSADIWKVRNGTIQPGEIA
jgi:DNA replication and repair protein RecF